MKPRLVINPHFAVDFGQKQANSLRWKEFLVEISNEGKLSLKDTVARVKLGLPKNFSIYDRNSGDLLATSAAP